MPDEKITPERAHEILGVSANASSDERHRVFREKRAILEKKLGQAPTDGLKAKYRASIDELEQALELLELAQTDRDLGVVRPVFTREESLPRVPVQAATGNDARPLVVSPPKRNKGGRELWIGVAGVVLLAALLGGWAWKAQATKAAEQARQTELAKQEAIARVAKDEAERRAAEERAARLRNEEERKREVERKTVEERAAQVRAEEERKREVERKTRGMLASLETELERLDQELRENDRTLSELKTTEREQNRAASRDLQWTRRTRDALEDYRSWLSDFSARHPARVRLKTARELLQGKDIDGAAHEAVLAESDWKKQVSELTGRKTREAQARRTREQEEANEKKVPRIAGEYAGPYTWSNGTGTRTLVINPDLKSGTDFMHVGSDTFTFPLRGDGTNSSFEAWNVPPNGSTYIADRLTILLSEDGNSVEVSHRDLKGNTGRGTLRRSK